MARKSRAFTLPSAILPGACELVHILLNQYALTFRSQYSSINKEPMNARTLR